MLIKINIHIEQFKKKGAIAKHDFLNGRTQKNEGQLKPSPRLDRL